MFLVVWEHEVGGLGDRDLDIYGQLVSSVEETPTGDSFPISSADDNQMNPSVVYNSKEANFLVAFESLEGWMSDIAFGSVIISANQAVVTDKSALTFDTIRGSNTDPNNITSNLYLPASGASGTTITWSSDKPSILSNDGTVNRPSSSQGDQVVYLTATIRKGNASDYKTFKLTVRAPAPSVTAPTNLKATATTSGIALSWDRVEAAGGYNIYRKEGTGAYLKITMSPVTTNTYADTTAKTGITYTYYVTAVGSDGSESGRSNEVTSSTSSFKDIPSDAWYISYVTRLVAESIVSGYPDNTFRPTNPVTRAEFSKMACLAMGWILVDPATASFKDVPNTHWAYKYIETAKARGAINGYPDGSFGPARNITRAEIAKIVAKVLNLPTGTSTLKDINTHWAKEYINSCVTAGIVGGYPDGAFRPDSTATRAEAAKMIVGVLDYR
ncbi:MAG: S-layer homology domain-containing protein [Actinobacteria bacterium]|nr:S-layer homology domain-containing protein [Actinomycetota bacterium]